MGACNSSESYTRRKGLTSVVKLDVMTSQAIDRMLKNDEKRQAREVKILLLGPGASGKSTILIIHLDGFNGYEREEFRRQIYVNLCQSMTTAGTIMEQQDVSFEHESNRARMQSLVPLVVDLRSGQHYPTTTLDTLTKLWQDAGVRDAFSRGAGAEILENATYFYSDLPRLFQCDYTPNNQDILRCRHKTTGISESVYECNSLTYRLFDVGGQRTERKKWVHCFENVTAVMFLVAMSGYDLCLLEDKESNQMQEALMLFDSICNTQWFRRTAIILFLNKVDLFKERILFSPIRNHFPDYDGKLPHGGRVMFSEHTPLEADRLIIDRRMACVIKLRRHCTDAAYTTAINTSLMKVVMASVYDNIVSGYVDQVLGMKTLTEKYCSLPSPNGIPLILPRNRNLSEQMSL
ncbi:BQ2448_6329 [Microbotryum intermedium]|uniref:BQ2448_6329 protein n=1 Tax=Microbotryum intermedium TaxID=269621 RepID=A0A238FM89_9BASI|nr:BQ2448_6329 [Microbotryum intermedium]